MKKILLQWITALALWFAIPQLTMAAPVTIFNDNVTAIFGSGNPDTGWTTVEDTSLGISLSLRAKNRTTGDTTNSNGTYSFATAPAPRGLWNYEASITNMTQALFFNYEYRLSVDRDPSQGVLYQTVDPLFYWNDNSFGMTTTANGAGFEGPAMFLYGTNQVAQLSQNITFGDYPGGALALDQNATYSYLLQAYNKGDIAGGPVLSTAITVVVGLGGDPVQDVPDASSTIIFMALGLCSLAGLRQKPRSQVLVRA